MLDLARVRIRHVRVHDRLPECGSLHFGGVNLVEWCRSVVGEKSVAGDEACGTAGATEGEGEAVEGGEGKSGAV